MNILVFYKSGAFKGFSPRNIAGVERVHFTGTTTRIRHVCRHGYCAVKPSTGSQTLDAPTAIFIRYYCCGLLRSPNVRVVRFFISIDESRYWSVCIKYDDDDNRGKRGNQRDRKHQPAADPLRGGTVGRDVGVVLYARTEREDERFADRRILRSIDDARGAGDRVLSCCEESRWKSEVWGGIWERALWRFCEQNTNDAWSVRGSRTSGEFDLCKNDNTRTEAFAVVAVMFEKFPIKSIRKTLKCAERRRWRGTADFPPLSPPYPSGENTRATQSSANRAD